MGATYETGFFSSPSDLLAGAQQADGQVDAIDAAIDGNESIPQDWWDGWTAFLGRWKAFYSSKFKGTAAVYASWFTTDLAGQLESFQGQIATWGAQAQKFGVSVAGGVTQPAANPLSGLGLPSSTTVIAIAVLFVVALFLWKVV